MLRPPPGQNLELLREWLQRPKYGNNFLQGFEARTWDVERADFVTLSNDEWDQDPLARWLFRIIPGCFHRRWAHRLKKPSKKGVRGGDLFEYEDAILTKVAGILSMILSTLFPTASVIILYSVGNMRIRLALILIFTMLFSISLLLASKARKVEIFAATSTYACPIILGCVFC